MSLTAGTGPLGPTPAGTFSEPVPEGVSYVEPFHRRVRGLVGGRTVVDSDRVLLVHEPGRPPMYAFLPEDVDGAETTPQPLAPGRVQIAWEAVDAWYEEEEQVLGYHTRSPYHRVDAFRTTRRLQVTVAGEVLVDTTDTLGVYETSIGPRLYVSRDAVRMDLLQPSATESFCGYKGPASYWTAVVGDQTVEDVAWSYDDPYPEASLLKGYLSFDLDRADVTISPPFPG